MSEIDREFLQRLARVRAPGCPTTADLGAYLDRTRGAEFNASVDEHLRACPACTNELVDLRELQQLERDGEPAPAELVANLREIRRAHRERSATAMRERGAMRARERGASTDAEAAQSWWQSLFDWLAEPRFAGAAVAATFVAVLAVALLRTTPEGLIPRGTIDPERLAAARAALVTVNVGGRAATGIAIAEDSVLVLDSTLGGAAEVEIAGGTATVAYRDALADLALLRVASAPATLRLAGRLDVVVGLEIVALDAAAAAPIRGTVASLGPARWQGDDGVEHEATLVEARLDTQPSALGTPVLTTTLDLAGVYAFSNGAASYAISADTIREFLAAAASPPR
jgi:anti-sigma factor RsiW